MVIAPNNQNKYPYISPVIKIHIIKPTLLIVQPSQKHSSSSPQFTGNILRN